MQPSGTDVFGQGIDLFRNFGNAFDGAGFKCHINAFGFQKRCVLKDQGISRFGQNSEKILPAQRVKFHPNGKTALKLRNQIRRLDGMKCAGCDKQNMVGFDRTVLGGNGRAFHNGQQIPLHPFAGNIRSVTAAFPDDLVNFVQENDSGLFHFFPCLPDHLVHIDQVLGFFLRKNIHGFRNLDLSSPRILGQKPAQHILEIDAHFFHADIGKNFHGGHGSVGNIQIHIAVVQFSGTQHAAKFFTG